MPQWLHEQLSKSAKKKGLSGEAKDAYIFGTLNKYEKAQKKVKGHHRMKALLGGN